MGLKEELANAKDAGEKAAKDAVAGGKKLLKNVGETVGEKAADVKQKAAEVGQEIRKHFKEKAYRTYIPRNIKLSEAPSAGLSIYDYAIASEGAKAYVALTREVIANAGEETNG